MPDTYIACAMSALPRAEYESFRETVLAVCDAVRAAGRKPYSEPFENSALQFDNPADAIKKNFQVLDQVTLFVLLYTTKEATSALIELGYAMKRAIPILVFAKEGITLPFYLRTINTSSSQVRVVPFSQESDLPEFVMKNLK